MNSKNIILALVISLTTLTVANAQSSTVWVSDEIEAPLRAQPELNAKILTLLPAGQKVTLLDENDDFVQIKTADGVEGWLSTYYVLRNISVHDQLAPLKEKLAAAEEQINELTQALEAEKSKTSNLESSKAALEKSASEVAEKVQNSEGSVQKLTSDNQLLRKKLTEQSDKMAELAKALDKEKQRASDARTRYLSLVKVSENVVEIDKQNRNLQEKTVKFETEIQRLKNENQTLKAKLDTRQAIFIALLIFGGIVAGYILSIMAPPRGRRSSGSYSSF